MSNTVKEKEDNIEVAEKIVLCNCCKHKGTADKFLRLNSYKDILICPICQAVILM